LTIFSDPYSGGFECIIPAETVLVVKRDQFHSQSNIDCVPEKYKELEKILVPKKERYDLKYGRYMILISNEDIDSKLELISRSTTIERKIYEIKQRICNSVLSEIFIVVIGIMFFLAIPLLLLLKPFYKFIQEKKVR